MIRNALVVGMGASGLFSSCLLANKGWKVTIVGRGTPTSAMSTGCIKGQIMNEGCLEEILKIARSNGMPMSGPGTGATNLGTRFDCGLSPVHSTFTDGIPNSITVIGIGDHPSLRPHLAASMLSSWAPKVDMMTADMGISPDMTLAMSFRDEARSDRLVEVMKDAAGESILLPPLFTLHDYQRMEELERRCGRKLVEAATPLGIPGQRFLDMLLTSAVSSGVKVWSGRKVTSIRTDGDLAVQVQVEGGSDSRRLDMDALLLATGGPLVDGTLLSAEGVVDPFNMFQTIDGPGIGGGYAHTGQGLRDRSGHDMRNVFGAGDCLCSGQRSFGNGLATVLDDAWRAVQAMEAP